MKAPKRLRGFLLDEGLHRIQLKNPRYQVKHVAKDFKKGGAKDPEVRSLAERNGLVLVTEDRGFKRTKPQKNTSIVYIVGTLGEKELVERLHKVLRTIEFPEGFKGCVFRATKEYVTRIHYEEEEQTIPYRHTRK